MNEPIKERNKKQIRTVLLLIAWVLVMMKPEQMNIPVLATLYTALLLIFIWVKDTK